MCIVHKTELVLKTMPEKRAGSKKILLEETSSLLIKTVPLKKKSRQGTTGRF